MMKMAIKVHQRVTMITVMDAVLWAWLLACLLTIPAIEAKECFYCHNCHSNSPGEIIECKADDFCVKEDNGFWFLNSKSLQRVNRYCSPDCPDPENVLQLIECCKGSICNSAPKTTKKDKNTLALMVLLGSMLPSVSIGTYYGLT